jgi:hypothetical protein
MADELDPKYPNAGQRRSGEGEGRSNEEEITGNVSEEDEEFEDIDDAEEDEEDLES